MGIGRLVLALISYVQTSLFVFAPACTPGGLAIVGSECLTIGRGEKSETRYNETSKGEHANDKSKQSCKEQYMQKLKSSVLTGAGIVLVSIE